MPTEYHNGDFNGHELCQPNEMPSIIPLHRHAQRFIYESTAKS